MILSESEMKDIVFEDGGDDFTIVEVGDWTEDHKYSFQDIIFHRDGEEQCYRMTHGKSGSYFTDWYYDVAEGCHPGEVVPVKKVEKTITVWEEVKNG